ncbi:type IV conjugative transfer system pilin TraA [Serratia liquefaciens]|uniref:type IV conjugative transfer system pilin TraA n=1 Tax=Serratia liquefaciens TaxID=614 RepID=UPI0032DEF62C
MSTLVADGCVSSKRSVFSKIANLFSRKKIVKFMSVMLPVAVLGLFFSDAAMATGGKDLMASGKDTVKKTFGSDSTVLGWVILAEVIVGGVMYMMTKNVKFLFGFAILIVFTTVGMNVAGY